MKNRVISLFVAVMMVLALVPIAALSETCAEAVQPAPVKDGETALITEVRIEGFGVPEAGNEIEFYGVFAGGDGYSVSLANWYVLNEDWFGWEDVIEGEVFEADRTYRARFEIRMDSADVVLADDAAVLINGSEEYVDRESLVYDEDLDCYSLWTTRIIAGQDDLIPIDVIEIDGFVIPEWGASPCFTVSVPEGAPYSFDSMYWYDDQDGLTMTPDDVFDDPSVNYYNEIILIPAEGYRFADEITIYINGTEDFTNYEWCGSSDCSYSVITVSFHVSAPVGSQGDVNLDGTVDITDALLIMRHSMDVVVISDPTALANADCNGDEAVDVTDAVLVMRSVMEA